MTGRPPEFVAGNRVTPAADHGFLLNGEVRDRICPAPGRVWRQRQEAAREADDVVCTGRAEEREVPIVVLDDKDAHEEAGGQWRERKRAQ